MEGETHLPSFLKGLQMSDFMCDILDLMSPNAIHAEKGTVVIKHHVGKVALTVHIDRHGRHRLSVKSRKTKVRKEE